MTHILEIPYCLLFMAPESCTLIIKFLNPMGIAPLWEDFVQDRVQCLEFCWILVKKPMLVVVIQQI